MNVLIADKFPENSLESLRAIGMEVEYAPALADDSLKEAILNHQPEVLVVRSTKVTGEMITGAENLHLIVRAGAGYNTIDVATASDLSVYVANCPGKNAVAVAELTLGHIINLDRRIPENVADIWDGKWNKKEYSRANGLLGSTLGVVGVGTIAKEVIVRARAFGLRVIAWSRSLDEATANSLGIGYCNNVRDVAEGADIVSVHLALTDDTRGLIGSDFFSAMKEGALFVNTSRAEVVDEKALLEAIESKNIRAGLDVMQDEPGAGSGSFDGEFRNHRNVYCTHHIGASTAQAQQAVADEVVAILETFRTSGRVRNCVNLQERTPAKFMLSVRHRNKVGVLSGILGIIREANINVESMENIIFSGVHGACANIQIDERLETHQLQRVRQLSEDIHSATLTAIEWA